MAKQVQAYAAADGKVFATEDEADRHDRRCEREARRERLKAALTAIWWDLPPLAVATREYETDEGFVGAMLSLIEDHWTALGVVHVYFNQLEAAYNDTKE